MEKKYQNICYLCILPCASMTGKKRQAVIIGDLKIKILSKSNTMQIKTHG